jgi:hypothetical protein
MEVVRFRAEHVGEARGDGDAIELGYGTPELPISWTAVAPFFSWRYLLLTTWWTVLLQLTPTTAPSGTFSCR